MASAHAGSSARASVPWRTIAASPARSRATSIHFPLRARCATAENAEVDWRNVEDEAALDDVVRPLLAPAAREAFDSGEYGTREFVAACAAPGHRPTCGGSRSDRAREPMHGMPPRCTVAWRLARFAAKRHAQRLAQRDPRWRARPCAARTPTWSPRSRHRCPASSSLRRGDARRVVDLRARGARRAMPRSQRDDVSQPRRGVVVRPRLRRRACGDRHRARPSLDARDEHRLPAARQRRSDRLRRRHAAFPPGEYRHQRLRSVPRRRGRVPVDADAARVPHALRQHAVRDQRIPVRRRQRRSHQERRVLVLLPARLPSGATRRLPRARRAKRRASRATGVIAATHAPCGPSPPAICIST